MSTELVVAPVVQVGELKVFTLHVGVRTVYGRPARMVTRRPHVMLLTAPKMLMLEPTGFGHEAPVFAATVTPDIVPLKRVFEPGAKGLVEVCEQLDENDVVLRRKSSTP